jgi:hypothetical protein
LKYKSQYKKIIELFPQHHQALKLVGLAPAYAPMLQEVLDLNKGKEKDKEEKDERDKQRN